MFEFWETADLKEALAKLGRAFASGVAELTYNGETRKYSTKAAIKEAAAEIVRELRRRGESGRPRPVRVLYPYQTGGR